MVKFWERARFWYAGIGFRKLQVQNLQTFCWSGCLACPVVGKKPAQQSVNLICEHGVLCHYRKWLLKVIRPHRYFVFSQTGYTDVGTGGLTKSWFGYFLGLV